MHVTFSGQHEEFDEMATASTAENPFPAQAVTTFGTRTVEGATFDYMRRALEFVNDYLRDYALAPTLPADSPNFPGGGLWDCKENMAAVKPSCFHGCS